MLLHLCNFDITVDDKNTRVDKNNDDNHNDDDGSDDEDSDDDGSDDDNDNDDEGSDDDGSDVELNMESSWHLELSSNTTESSHRHTPWS